jgi:hypothetical protein
MLKIFSGHLNFPAIYSKLLEALIRIRMRGPALQNSIKTAIPAHLWPFKMDKNCDALRFSQVELKTPIVILSAKYDHFTLEIASSVRHPRHSALFFKDIKTPQKSA